MSTTSSFAAANAPAELTRISPAYRARVWLATFGLLLFVALYISMAVWFSVIAYRLVRGVFMGGDGAFLSALASLPAAFLAIFMWKALFFVRPGCEDPGLEITEEQQPELFDFLNGLADEIGAPRPHRVFLSPNVNAFVFYNLTLLNFFLPAKKNLTIGIGLVNALNRSEFTAVLAHEFGHFAQRSMAVGRWVYVGEQIAAHIIAKRDFLDRTLDFISRIDLRVAWIGWIMRTIVWSIRSLLESVFRWVVLAHRALLREMEFQADLVAVTVTGSDAPVHALYRLQAADEDWERSLNFANEQLLQKRQVSDMCFVQSCIVEHMRRILNDPSHGQLPSATVTDAAQHRLFTDNIAQPPRMWSTHPPNTEREANAKRIYLPAALDDRPAWDLFRNDSEVREMVTGLLFDEVEGNLKEKLTMMTNEEVRNLLDEQLLQEHYEPSYRGAYLGRSVSLGVPELSQMYGTPPDESQLADSLSRLYPESLYDLLTQWRNTEEEVALLEAVQDGIYDASGGVIRHRGNVVQRAELPQLIEELKSERDNLLSAIEEHDRHVRTVHHAVAGHVQTGWKEYLSSLVKLLHYAEHGGTDLEDAHRHLQNVTAVATASGQVGSGKRRRIVKAANDLRGVMAGLDEQADKVELPAAVLHELKIDKWRDAFEFNLPAADEHNIGDWMQAVDGWVMSMGRCFESLRKSVLTELLKTEKYVAQLYLGEANSKLAPRCAVLPREYAKRTRGTERPIQRKLDWWSRFTLADGKIPSILRFAVAASIVAAALTAGALVGNPTVYVYNGLDTTVEAMVGENSVVLGPHQHESISAVTRQLTKISAHDTAGHLIESFEIDIDKPFASYVYNVATASPLMEITAVYGTTKPVEPRFLGTPRWTTTTAQHIFTEAPVEIKSSGDGGSRLVLAGASQLGPLQMQQMMADPGQWTELVSAHARWDSAESRYTTMWLMIAREQPDFDDVLTDRLRRNEKDIPALRMQQHLATPDEMPGIRNRLQQQAEAHPDDADWQYVWIRSLPDGPDQNQRFLTAHEKWPDHVWLSFAAGYVHLQNGDWEEGLAVLNPLTENFGPMFDSLAIEVARVRRVVAEDEPASLDDLRSSFFVDYLVMVESGEDLEGTPLYAYRLLQEGKLEEAVEYAVGGPQESSIVILAAASGGAPQSIQRRALEIPLEEVGRLPELLYLAALSRLNGKSAERYLDEFVNRDEAQDYVSVGKIAEGMLQDDHSRGWADEDIVDVTPEYRGHLMVMAFMLFPEEAPDEWRDTAEALLFASERPKF